MPILEVHQMSVSTCVWVAIFCSQVSSTNGQAMGRGKRDLTALMETAPYLTLCDDLCVVKDMILPGDEFFL